jgi:hypothetical protein
MKRIWLVPLSGALVTATMALAVDDASAAYRSGVTGSRVAARGVGINRVGVNRAGVYRRGIYRGGVYGTRYGAYRPGLRAAAVGVAVGAAAASTAGYYGDDAPDNRYRGVAYANRFGDRAYYNVADRTYQGGIFDSGVYRPAGVYGYDSTLAPRSTSSSGYPTRAIVSRSYVPVFSYYGPLCNPRVDSGCQ